MFLQSQVMDEARHLDVFRKRALVNGGGLMRRAGSLSVVGANIDSSRDLTEMSARLHITGEGSVLTLFRTGELMAYNEAEKHIYRLCAQDESRHVAFGVMHLQYIGHSNTDRREEIQQYLDEAEQSLVNGAGQNPAARGLPSNAALAILLGGGEDKMEDGFNTLLAVRQRQVKEYVQRVRVAGFGSASKTAAPCPCSSSTSRRRLTAINRKTPNQNPARRPLVERDDHPVGHTRCRAQGRWTHRRRAQHRRLR